MRLDIEKQNRMEPERISHAKKQFEKLGIKITETTDRFIAFIYKDQNVTFWPYSGWHSGSSIKDGRGLNNLLKQIK